MELIKSWDSLDEKEQDILLRFIRSMQETNEKK